jgi:hypothetical protein
VHEDDAAAPADEQLVEVEDLDEPVDGDVADLAEDPELVDDEDLDGLDGDEGEALDGEEDDGTRRRNALPRRVESWRQRSASGAIATAIAMGLQQVFEPEQRRPAIVQEAPGDPYDEDDPITVDYVPDDAEATVVTIKPWLLKKDGEDA